MPPAKNPHGWKWFFLILGLLSLSATVSLICYNLWQQLTPEQFDAARKRWNQHGPKSYHLSFKESFTSADGQTASNEYAVTVRNGKVVDVVVNGIPKTERLDYHDMKGIF